MQAGRIGVEVKTGTSSSASTNPDADHWNAYKHAQGQGKGNAKIHTFQDPSQERGGIDWEFEGWAEEEKDVSREVYWCGQHNEKVGDLPRT